MKFIINEIKKYIEEKYEIEVKLKEKYLLKNNVYIKSKKYDLNIGIGNPDRKHYLYGKCDYYLAFDYNANKKYRNELCWAGGGFHDKHVPNDYSNIDKFIGRFIDINPCQKQMTIFDFIDEGDNL